MPAKFRSQHRHNAATQASRPSGKLELCYFCILYYRYSKPKYNLIYNHQEVNQKSQSTETNPTTKNVQSQTNLESISDEQNVSINRETVQTNQSTTNEHSTLSKVLVKEDKCINICSTTDQNKEAVSDSFKESLMLASQAQDKQIDCLNKELILSKETIDKLRNNESKLRERSGNLIYHRIYNF